MNNNYYLILVMVIILKKVLYIFILLFTLIIIYRVIDIKYINNDYYQSLYNSKSNNIIYGNSAKRGRILDTNNKVLVDNKSIYNINYRIINNKSYKDIYNDALLLDEFIKEEANDNEINRFKELLVIDNINSSAIHIFFKMIDGYKKDTKLIKSDVPYDVCLMVEQLNIDGLFCDISSKRIINYSFIESIIGNVGSIPMEEKKEYLNKGYLLTDMVGISGLEKYYEDILRGSKAKYIVNKDNSLSLLEEEISGKDIVLALDINIQEKAYNILKDSFNLKLDNTKYYNEAFIIVSDVNTGEIITMQGLNRNGEDISIKSALSSYIVGSVVKGASHSVSYLNNLIDIDKKINDSCVKLYNVPMKCSFKRLGYIDDISSLKLSSNYYQFINAIKSTNNSYYPNIKINIDYSNFDKYRSIFNKFGLGSLTNIDLPKESSGIKGDKVSIDLLLNYVIGQYDTYTPLELSAYINTIANRGKRYSLSLIKKQNEVIDVIDMDDIYWNRIEEGFYQVINSYDGTGLGYCDKRINAVGKTGTSQNYVSNELMTINSTFVMYAPRDNPKYSVVVVTPNVSYYNSNEYIAPINRIISKKITNYVFENN